MDYVVALAPRGRFPLTTDGAYGKHIRMPGSPCRRAGRWAVPPVGARRLPGSAEVVTGRRGPAPRSKRDPLAAVGGAPRAVAASGPARRTHAEPSSIRCLKHRFVPLDEGIDGIPRFCGKTARKCLQSPPFGRTEFPIETPFISFFSVPERVPKANRMTEYLYDLSGEWIPFPCTRACILDPTGERGSPAMPRPSPPTAITWTPSSVTAWCGPTDNLVAGHPAPVLRRSPGCASGQASFLGGLGGYEDAFTQHSLSAGPQDGGRAGSIPLVQRHRVFSATRSRRSSPPRGSGR